MEDERTQAVDRRRTIRRIDFGFVAPGSDVQQQRRRDADRGVGPVRSAALPPAQNQNENAGRTMPALMYRQLSTHRSRIVVVPRTSGEPAGDAVAAPVPTPAAGGVATLGAVPLPRQQVGHGRRRRRGRRRRQPQRRERLAATSTQAAIGARRRFDQLRQSGPKTIR